MEIGPTQRIAPGEEVTRKVFEKVKPLNNIGTYIALGIGAFVLVELFNSKAGETFANTVYLSEFKNNKKMIFDHLPLAADDMAPQLLQWKLQQASKGYTK